MKKLHRTQTADHLKTLYSDEQRCRRVGALSPNEDVKCTAEMKHQRPVALSLIHISEPTRLGMISYAVFCLKKKNKT